MAVFVDQPDAFAVEDGIAGGAERRERHAAEGGIQVVGEPEAGEFFQRHQQAAEEDQPHPAEGGGGGAQPDPKTTVTSAVSSTGTARASG